VNSKTLPVGLLDYTSEFTIDWRGMCALAVVMIAPAFALTFIIQKRLVSGLTFGAVKGWATVALERPVKRYGPVEAVRSIDLEIADQEFVALVGPSGCGKSTTLRMIAGLEDISSGTIRIGGEIVNDLSPRSRNISMVFQSYALCPHMSVRENMAFSLKIAKRPQTEIDARVAEASDILHLGELLDRRPSQLSGGQRQRVAMGRAIVRKPEVFLFDEPLSNLDAKLRAQMRTEIKLLHGRVPSTVVYVTHDQIEAMTLADRIVVMRDGLIEQVGSPDDVFHRPATRFVAGFIGSPAMNPMDAEISDGRIVFPGGDWLPIPDRFKTVTIFGRRIALGMRPDDVYPSGHGLPSAAGSQVVERQLPVSVTEPLGNETLVFVPFGGRDWLARMLNPIPLEPGQKIAVSFDLAKAHLFSTDGGQAIAAAGG